MTTTQTTSQLVKSASFYNPYFFEGRQIHKICFFNSDGVIISVNWFGSNNKYPTLVIPSEIKRKNKVDFLSKTAFYVSAPDKGKGYIYIYVPANLVNLQDIGESVYFDNENETQYMQNYKITVHCSEDKMQLKEGCSHDDFQPYEYIITPVESREIKFDVFSKNVKKDKYHNDQLLRGNIKTICGIDVNMYDLQKILKHYDITPKP